MDVYNEIKQGEKGAWLSIIAYVCLSSIKIVIGHFTNSEALSADGLNNATDIMASLAVLIGLKISRKPPDKDHRYGHFRAETIAAMVASFIMLAVGIDVLKNAVTSLFHPKAASPDLVAAWTALFCALVMYLIYRYNLRLATRINNHALMAAAQDNKSDSFVSVGAFIGIIGSQFGLAWLDSLTATVVGIIICKTAWEIFRDASLTLTDGFDEAKLVEYHSTIASIPGVELVSDLKARVHGNSVLLDVVIGVKSDLSVKESHDITIQIEKQMKKKYKINYVHIHIEPVAL